MSDEITRRAFIGTTAAIVVTARILDIEAATASVLEQDDRRTLQAAMDRIIPAAGRMPGASAIGGITYVEGIVDRHAGIGTSLGEALRRLGAGFTDSPAKQQITALKGLERSHPAAFGTLRDLVYEAYYTNPEVWKLLGYRFRTGAKRTSRLEAFDERQLERVRQMPRLYREAE